MYWPLQTRAALLNQCEEAQLKEREAPKGNTVNVYCLTDYTAYNSRSVAFFITSFPIFSFRVSVKFYLNVIYCPQCLKALSRQPEMSVITH